MKEILKDSVKPLSFVGMGVCMFGIIWSTGTTLKVFITLFVAFFFGSLS